MRHRNSWFIPHCMSCACFVNLLCTIRDGDTFIYLKISFLFARVLISHIFFILYRHVACARFFAHRVILGAEFIVAARQDTHAHIACLVWHTQVSLALAIHFTSVVTGVVAKERSPNNGVFTAVFIHRHAACEDAGQAAYSQSYLHVTGEYNYQQAGISCYNYRMLHAVHFTCSKSHLYSHRRSQKLKYLSV